MAATHILFRQAVPGGDWFCPDCRPKQRSRRLKSHQQRHPVDDEEEEEDEDDDDNDDEEDVEEEDEEESAEEEESEELSEEEITVRYDGKYFCDLFMSS